MCNSHQYIFNDKQQLVAYLGHNPRWGIRVGNGVCEAYPQVFDCVFMRKLILNNKIFNGATIVLYLRNTAIFLVKWNWLQQGRKPSSRVEITTASGRGSQGTATALRQPLVVGPTATTALPHSTYHSCLLYHVTELKIHCFQCYKCNILGISCTCGSQAYII